MVPLQLSCRLQMVVFRRWLDLSMVRQSGLSMIRWQLMDFQSRHDPVLYRSPGLARTRMQVSHQVMEYFLMKSQEPQDSHQEYSPQEQEMVGLQDHMECKGLPRLQD